MGIQVSSVSARFLVGAAIASARAFRLALSRAGWLRDLRPCAQIMAEWCDVHLAVGQFLCAS